MGFDPRIEDTAQPVADDTPPANLIGELGVEKTPPYQPTEDERVMFVGELGADKTPDDLNDVEPSYTKRWQDSRRNPVIDDMAAVAYEILNDPASAGEGQPSAPGTPQESPETISSSSKGGGQVTPETMGQHSGKGPSRAPKPQKLPYLDDERTREFIISQVMAGKSGEEVAKLFESGVEDTLLDPGQLAADFMTGGFAALPKAIGSPAMLRFAARLLQGRTIGKNILLEMGIGQAFNLAAAGIDEAVDTPALSVLATVVGIPVALALGAGGYMAISKNVMRAKGSRPDLAKKMMEIGEQHPESSLGKAATLVKEAEQVAEAFKPLGWQVGKGYTGIEAEMAARRKEILDDLPSIMEAAGSEDPSAVYRYLADNGWKGQPVNSGMAQSIRAFVKSERDLPFPTSVEEDGLAALKFKGQSAGSEWYRDSPFVDMFKDASDQDIILFHALLSHTSRQSDPATNLTKALKAWDKYKAGMSPAEIASETGLGREDIEKMFKNPEETIRTFVHLRTGMEMGDIKLKNYAETLRLVIQDPDFLKSWENAAVVDVRMNQYYYPSKAKGKSTVDQAGMSALEQERVRERVRRVTQWLRKNDDPDFWTEDRVQAALWYEAQGKFALRKPGGSFGDIVAERARKYYQLPADTKPEELERFKRAYVRTHLEGSQQHLYDHYTSKQTKDVIVIDPSKQGTAHAGAEMKGRLPGDRPDAMHFYPAGADPEAQFWTKPRYRAVVNSGLIYDMDANPLNLVPPASANHKAIGEMERKILDAGYVGLKTRDVTILYDPVKAFRMVPHRLNISPSVTQEQLDAATDPAVRTYLSQVKSALDGGDEDTALNLVRDKFYQIMDHPLIECGEVRKAAGVYGDLFEFSLQAPVQGPEKIVLAKMADFLKYHNQMEGHAVRPLPDPVVAGKRPAGIPQGQEPSTVWKFPRPLSGPEQKKLGELLATHDIGMTYYGNGVAIVDHLMKKTSPAKFTKAIQAIENELKGWGELTPRSGQVWNKIRAVEAKSYGKHIKAGERESKQLGAERPPPDGTRGARLIPSEVGRRMESYLYGESPVPREGGESLAVGMKDAEPGDKVYSLDGKGYYHRGVDIDGNILVSETFSGPTLKEARRPEELTINKPSVGKAVAGQATAGAMVGPAAGLEVEENPDGSYTVSLDPAKAIGGMVLGAAGVAAAGSAVKKLGVFHGSPHKPWAPEPGFPHGRPRLDKVGSGEGGAYKGWGWYSAEADQVAKTYLNAGDNLQQVLADSGYKHRLGRDDYPAIHRELMAIKRGWTTTDKAAGSLRHQIKWASKMSRDEVKGLIEKFINTPATLYKLDIPDEVAPKLLDLDKTYEEQSDYVKRALSRDPWVVNAEGMTIRQRNDALTSRGEISVSKDDAALWDAVNETDSAYHFGEALQHSLAQKLGSKKAASELLASIGIPGNTYFDKLSRSRQEGSHNYVIWDQKVLDQISILEKNGEVLDAAGKGYNAIDQAISKFKQSKAGKILGNEGGFLELGGGAPKGVSNVEMSPENIARFQEIAGEPTMMGGVPKRGPIVSWSGETTDKAANVNFNYINTPDDTKQALEAIAETFPKEIDEARRGTITFEETRQLADALGMSADDLIKRQRGQAFNAEQAFAARTMLVNSAAVLADLAKKAADPAADLLTQLEFRKQLNLHYSIQSQVSGMTAEAGRALNQFKMVTTEAKRDMQYLQDLMKALPDSAGMSTSELAGYISKIDNPEGLAKMVTNLRKVTSFNMFMEYWINALLSGPQTHAVNMLSNTLTSLWVLGEKGIAAGLGAMVGRNNFGLGSFAHNAYGLVEGFKDGLKAAMRSMKTGEATDLGTKMDLPGREPAITAEHLRGLFDDTKLSGMTGRALEQGGPVARAVDLMGEIVRTPTKMLQAEDELFKSVGYRMHLRGEAYRRASQEGLTGQARAERMAQIMSDPELHAPDISMGAINAARYQTFTSELGEAGKNFMGILREVPALRLIVPFVRTPTNILKFAFERTPGLGILSKRMREDLVAGGARRDLAIAKQALGGLTMTAGATLAAQGMITGGGPVDPAERANLMRTGWQPYSLKVGDKYISYNRIEPVGMLLGAAADFAEISGLAGEELQPEIDDLAAAILMAISKNATSKTWLQGVSNAIEAIEDPKRYGTNYIERMAGTLVPTLSAQVERTVSPEVEEVNGMIEALKARVPGLSKDLKPRRDLWGEPITRSIVPTEERGWATMAFESMNPFYISQDTDSPIDQEMVRLKTHVQKPGKVQSIQGIPIELMPEEMDQLEEIISKIKLNSTGKGLKASLNEMVKHDADYKRRSDELKDAMIRAKITEARELARQELYDKNPEIRDLVEQGREEKQRSMQ